MTNSQLQPEDEAWLAWARETMQQDPLKIALIKHLARLLQSSRVEMVCNFAESPLVLGLSSSSAFANQAKGKSWTDTPRVVRRHPQPFFRAPAAWSWVPSVVPRNKG
jgi:hypothetical protein